MVKESNSRYIQETLNQENPDNLENIEIEIMIDMIRGNIEKEMEIIEEEEMGEEEMVEEVIIMTEEMIEEMENEKNQNTLINKQEKNQKITSFMNKEL